MTVFLCRPHLRRTSDCTAANDNNNSDDHDHDGDDDDDNNDNITSVHAEDDVCEHVPVDEGPGGGRRQGPTGPARPARPETTSKAAKFSATTN